MSARSPYEEIVKALTGEDPTSFDEKAEGLFFACAIADHQYIDEFYSWAHDREEPGPCGSCRAGEDPCEACTDELYVEWVASYLSSSEIGLSTEEALRHAGIMEDVRLVRISREILVLDDDSRDRVMTALAFGTGWMDGIVDEARFDDEGTARLFGLLEWFNRAVRVPEAIPVDEGHFWVPTVEPELGLLTFGSLSRIENADLSLGGALVVAGGQNNG